MWCNTWVKAAEVQTLLLYHRKKNSAVEETEVGNSLLTKHVFFCSLVQWQVSEHRNTSSMKLTDTLCASFPSSRFLSVQKYYLVMLPFQKDLQANVKGVFLIDFFHLFHLSQTHTD